MRNDSLQREITELSENYIRETDALDLVWRVFTEFEAPEYSDEGIAEFKAFIEPEHITEVLAKDELRIWGCFDGARIIGVIALKPPGHISLLFVDGAFHRQGVARSLYNTVLRCCRKVDVSEITVNSSPYAVEAYRRLGFVHTDTEQVVNGLRFTPMKHSCAITYSETKEFTSEELYRLFSSVGWFSANYPDRLVKAMRGASSVISAWDGGRLVGLVNALDGGELTAYVHYLLVDSDYHGLGIGKKLALAVKGKYANYLYIVLIVESKDNISFYENLGFQITQSATSMDITNP